MKEFVKSVYGCNKLEDENFKGVQKCEFCSLEQIILEQVKIDLDREKANEVHIGDRGEGNR